MQHIESFSEGNCYHIYNRGINSCNIFIEKDNYRHFLFLYKKYITSITDTYAWVLMPNHFHFLVKLKDSNPVRVLNPDRVKVQTPSQQFSKLFNAYAQSFNKRYKRHGGLFERPFQRKLVESEEYLNELIIYIHNNPVKHGFCNSPDQYEHSSYLYYINKITSPLINQSVIDWFDDLDNFEYVHNNE